MYFIGLCVCVRTHVHMHAYVAPKSNFYWINIFIMIVRNRRDKLTKGERIIWQWRI